MVKAKTIRAIKRAMTKVIASSFITQIVTAIISEQFY